VRAAGPRNGAWQAGGMLENLSLPVVLDSRLGPVTLRRASAEDLDSLMMLLSDDPVSAARGCASSERCPFGRYRVRDDSLGHGCCSRSP